ncbi:MAG TPA: DUF2510 domain-containing protein, partial [Actinomycetota bacterium]|nr:DUF2510 domain-containing protein [Actinomycetota bacterium]
MAAAGWYVDPTRAHVLRWYDGAAWTAHVFDGERRTTDPGGPPAGELPAPEGDDVWLPHPGLPETKRWGPFAVGVPSGGPAAVPVGGYEPVLTGNRALDLTQGYVNEFESQLRRDASLVRSTWDALRSARALPAIGVVLSILALAAFLGLVALGYTLLDSAFSTPGGSPFGAFFVIVALLVFVLPPIFVVPNVVAFACAVAAGLIQLEGSRGSAFRYVRRAARARGPLTALALARAAWWVPGLSAKAGGALYEAYTVLAVPAAMDERIRLGDA